MKDLVTPGAPGVRDRPPDSLEQVLDHYAAGGSPDDPAQDPQIQPLTPPPEDRRALVALLQALTSRRLPARAGGAY